MLSDIKIRAQGAYRAGYQFHRNEVLLINFACTWVRKKIIGLQVATRIWQRHLPPVKIQSTDRSRRCFIGADRTEAIATSER